MTALDRTETPTTPIWDNNKPTGLFMVHQPAIVTYPNLPFTIGISDIWANQLIFLRNNKFNFSVAFFFVAVLENIKSFLSFKDKSQQPDRWF